jgi:tRNA G18 (ribose-2'-O)-methylase SpoU
MRGYFGIGIEGVNKPMNVGALMRTAHAFEASFVFTIGADYTQREGRKADTSDSWAQVPFYAFPSLDAFSLPKGCRLVGVELIDEAVELPSFRHPPQAAYVLGREKGSLTPELVARCDHVVKIPTRFCVNVAVAGAILMYDRLLAAGRFASRALHAGGPPEPLAAHVHGAQRFRTPERMARFGAKPPSA